MNVILQLALRAGRRRQRIGVAAARALAMIAVLGTSLSLSMHAPCLAQDATSAPFVAEDAMPEISRDEWRDRVREAKRRAREAAIERRAHPELFLPPPPEDPDIIASERVLRDDSLQFGDIVATKKGLFVFRGRGDQPRSEADFVPLPSR